MERQVKLEGFPDGLRFPESLANRISHDPAAGRLAYRGVMSKADFDRLVQVHPSWAYRRALEELFRLCIEPDEPPKRTFGLGRLFGGRPRMEAGSA